MRKVKIGTELYDRYNGNTLLVLKKVLAPTWDRSDGETAYFQEFSDGYETIERLSATPHSPGPDEIEVTRIPVYIRLDAETKQGLPNQAEWLLSTSMIQPGKFELRPAVEFTSDRYRAL